MKTIIINGANGYVASNFIHKLLQHNYKVVALVRPGVNSSPKERMIKALTEISDGAYVNTANLKVLAYSLLHKDFLIPPEELEEIFSGDVDYFHFAASLKFDFKSKEEIFETNVEGVENSIRVFSKYTNSNSRFFFIGTAYSCGKFSGRYEEKFYPNEGIENFRNYYEQSKRFAENVLKKHIDENGLNGHVIRLSQVVGNNKTGVTKTDYGIFDFAKRMYSLAFRHPNQTVRVHVDPISTQNLIPIDMVVNYLIRTVEVKYVPAIMNIVAGNPVKNIHIIKSINKLLPVNIVPELQLEHAEMNALERIISAGMTFTESYIDTDLQFGTKNSDKLFLVNGYEVNESSVYKMLEYFIGNLATKKSKKAMVSAL
ncbi:MAG TPA: NAD-dependent epimerase/dehydratase family protein [Mariniphaga anaerophila]|uniref:NAD-dependent epimerase/dehydratase family protein n=1 Tax=Mariniphaga anaerophila TaxID=1484053 RepID=A0A831LQS2_9BACT|nr:NAD-dependent epimerase/dehydratase family protein [Mariniphaga anaerophila]